MTEANSKGFWVGIDVSKDTLQAAAAPHEARPDQWAELVGESFSFDAGGISDLISWIGQQPSACQGICAESTGVYSKRLATALSATELPPAAIVNPARTKAFGRSMGVRDKTDRVDAAVIALYGLTHRPQPLRQTSPQHERLRQLWRLREDNVRERTAFKCRIEQADDAFVKRQLRRTLRHFSAMIEGAEKEMERVIGQEETLERDAQLLQSVPGVGRLTAWMLLGELGDLRTWGRRQIVGYVGLFPRLYESGTSVHRRPRLARGGGTRVRSGLFLAALGVRRHKTALSAFGDNLVERGKTKMCAIGALMRKILIIARAVIISGRPFDPAMIGRVKNA